MRSGSLLLGFSGFGGAGSGIVNNHQSSPPQPHHHEVALCYGEALLSVALSCSLKQLQYFYHCNKIVCCQKEDASRRERGTFLIVSPGSVLYNWKDELETWGHFNTGLFHGNAKEDTLQRAFRGRLDVVLTTYETMRNHLVSCLCTAKTYPNKRPFHPPR